MIALHSYQLNKDGEVYMRCTVYAATEEQADRILDLHGDDADAADTIEIVEEDAEAPDAEELERVSEAQEGVEALEEAEEEDAGG